MRPTKYLLILTLSLSSGCTLFDEKVVVQKEPIYLAVICPDPAQPAAITTLKVRPQVIEDKVGIFWVGLSAKDYENLSINIQESIRYIKDSRGQTKYYRSCIIAFNENIDNLKNAPIP